MTPTAKDIIQAIAEHLALTPQDFDRHAFLREDLGLGPIELNELLDFLTKKFGVIFERDDVENLKKLEDIIVLVEDNLID